MIAIHHRSGSFSDRWIQYCEDHQIGYILVDCHDSNIFDTLKKENVTHLMWHFHHNSTVDKMVAEYIFNAAETIGIKTFPNYNTRWHFDDKVAQQYLFKALDIDSPQNFVFYEKNEALNFIRSTALPVVAKLKRGAGANNVKLIRSISEGEKYINKMFGRGIYSGDRLLKSLDQKRRLAKKINSYKELFKKVEGHWHKVRNEKKNTSKEKGYVYFQEFMPHNEFDTRIIVIGDKAIGIRRFNRSHDFRASGSGLIDFKSSEIDIRTVESAFKASDKIGAQCMAYDFVFDAKKNPLIIEMCYAFSMLAYDKCEGYWDKNLNFHQPTINAQFVMIENLLNE